MTASTNQTKQTEGDFQSPSTLFLTLWVTHGQPPLFHPDLLLLTALSLLLGSALHSLQQPVFLPTSHLWLWQCFSVLTAHHSQPCHSLIALSVVSNPQHILAQFLRCFFAYSDTISPTRRSLMIFPSSKKLVLNYLCPMGYLKGRKGLQLVTQMKSHQA